MIISTKRIRQYSCAVALGLAGTALLPSAQAAIISLDITSNSGDDAYGQGAGVFGDASTQWNERIRFSSQTASALFDETGAATGVTVTYTRNSGFGITVQSGTYDKLGTSHVATGTVVFDGLSAGVSYDLAIYSADAGSPGWTVGGGTQTTTQTFNWSSLSSGGNYVLFQVAANGSGQVSFSSTNSKGWSAVQIQPTAAVPEPSEYGLAFGLAILGAGVALRQSRSGPKDI